MSKKRYAIVRADKFCPRDLERNYKLKCIGSLHCDKCDLKKNYGDTKEQLVLKVQQALFKSIFNEQVQKAVSIEEQKRIYKNYRPMAEKVVEFLGVEE